MNARHVALGIAVAALIGVVAASRPQTQAALKGAANLVGVSVTPANSSVDTGASYLVANQPWLYGAPSSAVMPSVAQQTAGGSATSIPQFDASGCGCF